MGKPFPCRERFAPYDSGWQFVTHGTLLPLGDSVAELYPLATYQGSLLVRGYQSDQDMGSILMDFNTRTA